MTDYNAEFESLYASSTESKHILAFLILCQGYILSHDTTNVVSRLTTAKNTKSTDKSTWWIPVFNRAKCFSSTPLFSELSNLNIDTTACANLFNAIRSNNMPVTTLVELAYKSIHLK